METVDEGCYLTYGGERHGPYDAETVQGWHAAGELPSDALVWMPGSSTWVPAAAVLGPTDASLGELASPVSRLGAAVIDVLACYLVWVAILGPAIFLGQRSDYGFFFVVAALMVFLTPVGVGLWPIIATGRSGATYGKNLLGITVVKERRSPATIGVPAAFGRSIVLVLGAGTFGFGLLWALWDDRLRGWHDLAVGSVVVKTDRPKTKNPFAHLARTFRRAG